MFQDAYPWRVKGLYLLHCNYLIRNTYAMMRPLIKKKIADRVRHKDYINLPITH